jgi:hypothetical protein
VKSHGALDKIMVQAIEERLDIQINDPVGRPAAPPGGRV